MANHRFLSAASFAMALLATGMSLPGLRAADRFDPRDGWTVATARPDVHASQQSSAGAAESLWTNPHGAISEPEPSTVRVKHHRNPAASAARSASTDREQRIVLTSADLTSSAANPLRDETDSEMPPEPVEQSVGGFEPRDMVNMWSADETIEPALQQPHSLEVPELRSDSILPASHSMFSTRAAHPREDAAVAQTNYVDPACEPYTSCACEPDCGVDYYCEPSCASATGVLGSPAAPRWSIGYELVLVKPRFENNVAFTVMEDDGAQAESFTEMEFDYDRDPTTRVWMDYELAGGVGCRAAYWHLDELPTTVSATPPSNGFGFILHPEFGDIDISTNVPTDTFTARSTIEVFCVDLEMTKSLEAESWTAVFSGGLRYAEIEQSYVAQRRAQDSTLLGEIDFAHHLKGFGPTIAMQAARPLIGTLRAFSTVRGSLLFGDGEARLEAIEGAPTDPPLVTTRNSGRDDLLPIGEMQAGLFWECPAGQNAILRPFLMAALEGQVWGGAGNASSEDGSVGFFGVSLGGGTVW